MYQKILGVILYKNAEDAYSDLQRIFEALHFIQSDERTIADAVSS